MPSEYPKRKITRLQCYDYSWRGSYFVTICTHNRTCLFGSIRNGELELFDQGKIVAQAWTEIPIHFPFVRSGEYVVMPNHFHGLLYIENEPNKPDSEKTDKACLVPTIPNRFGHPGTGSLSTIIGAFKAASTREIHKIYPEVGFIWQSRFQEHIIRDEHDFNTHMQYIIDNPSNWDSDEQHP